jgi:hypothetical protein
MRDGESLRELAPQARHELAYPRETIASRNVVREPRKSARRVDANPGRALLILFQHAQWELVGTSGNCPEPRLSTANYANHANRTKKRHGFFHEISYNE